MTRSLNGDKHAPAKGGLKLSATALAAAAVFIIGFSTPWLGDAPGDGGVAVAAGTEAEAGGVGFAPLVLAEELETPTIKSYPEEFARALSPVTSVRGKRGDIFENPLVNEIY